MGHYKNDEREGIGEMIWTDGSLYIGEWVGGIQHGYGRMYFPDGTIKEGLFNKNVFRGKTGLESYNIPKELLDENFDIMRYAEKDMQFSEEIMTAGKNAGIEVGNTIYSTSITNNRKITGSNFNKIGRAHV